MRLSMMSGFRKRSHRRLGHRTCLNVEVCEPRCLFAGDSSLGGTVYIDANQDGRIDPAEGGVPGVLITLTGRETTGAQIRSMAISDDQGDFLFANLGAGSYTLTQTQPVALAPSQSNSANEITSISLTTAQSQLEHNFSEIGILPEFLSIEWHFASTLSTDVLRSMVAMGEHQAGRDRLANAIRLKQQTFADDGEIPSTNRAPQGTNDQYVVVQPQPLSVNVAQSVLTNDSDADGDNLTASLVTGPQHGSLTLEPNGTFVYSPVANYVGSDQFTYRVFDTKTFSTNVIVSLDVRADPNQFSVPESASVGATIGIVQRPVDFEASQYTLVTTDVPFTIDSTTGTLKLSANVDYEAKSKYLLDVRLTDTAGSSRTIPIQVAVSDVNEAPRATSDSYSVNQGSVLEMIASRSVLVNDTDPEGTPLTAKIVQTTSHGTLVLDASGTFTYTPTVGFVGNDEFKYTAEDGTLPSNATTVTISVVDINLPPVAVSDDYMINEDGILNVPVVTGVLSNDDDADNDELVATVVTTPLHGTLTLRSDGSFDYDPDVDYFGTDTFTYRASDGRLDSSAIQVKIEVTSVNDLPVATNDTYSMQEGGTLIVATANGILANDSDVETVQLSAVVERTTEHGQLTLQPDGSFRYVPNVGFFGTDTFTYRASDGQSSSSVATVSITIADVPVAPTAAADNYEITEDGRLEITSATGVLTNDVDGDGDPITSVLQVGPSSGTLSLQPNGAFVYTPNPNFFGTDQFKYKAFDGGLSSPETVVTIVVQNVNDAPVPVSDAYGINEDMTLEVNASLGVLANDVDVDQDRLTASVSRQPEHGVLTLRTDGSFTYVPNANYFGLDEFVVSVTDTKSTQVEVPVQITITAVNDIPQGGGDSYSLTEDGELNVLPEQGILVNDADVETTVLIPRILRSVEHGSMDLASNGGFHYEPNANFSGTDSFTYVVSDGDVDSLPVTVVISISGVEDPPEIQAEQFTVAKGTVLELSAAAGVLANDSDGDRDNLTVDISSLSAPFFGQLRLGRDGSVRFSPLSTFSGFDSFRYRITDGKSFSRHVTATIRVTSDDTIPQAIGDEYVVDAGTILNVAAPGLLSNDTDPEGSNLIVLVLIEPEHGKLEYLANGAFTYEPEAGFSGIDTFVYRVNDGLTASSEVMVKITVRPLAEGEPAELYEVSDAFLLQPSLVDQILSLF